MKAMLCTAPGTSARLVLEELPLPTLQADDVHIAIHALGVNFADTLLVAGQLPLPTTLPFSPGYELAGIVISTGTQVKDFQPGDRVLAITHYGTYAEEIVLSATHVVHMPEHMDMLTGASFPIAYATAYIFLKHRASLLEKETLMVLGATGNVGSAAINVGRQLGARLIAVTGHPELLLGEVDSVINAYQEDLVAQIKEYTRGQGVQVIFDTIGGHTSELALLCLAWEGRFLPVGFASGQTPQISFAQVLAGNYALIGSDLASYMTRDPVLVTQSLAEVLRWYAAGAMKLRHPCALPLEDANKVLDIVANRQSNEKFVLTTRYSNNS